MAKDRRKLKRVQRLDKASRKSANADRIKLDQFWTRQVPELELLAREALKEADHYGGFQVGGAALVRFQQNFFTVTGSNRKGQPGPRLECDHCAEEAFEQSAIEEAQKRGFKCEEIELVGFVVVAPQKADDFADFDFGVTISCGHDRRRWRGPNYDGPVKPHTRGYYVNANAPKQRVELSVESLLAVTAKRDAKKSS